MPYHSINDFMATWLQILKKKNQQVISVNLFNKEMRPPPSNCIFWRHDKFNDSFLPCLQKCFKFSTLNNRKKNNHATSLLLEVIMIGELMIASDALCPGHLVWRSLRPQSLDYSASVNCCGSLPTFAANKFILLTSTPQQRRSRTTSLDTSYPVSQK